MGNISSKERCGQCRKKYPFPNDFYHCSQCRMRCSKDQNHCCSCAARQSRRECRKNYPSGETTSHCCICRNIYDKCQTIHFCKDQLSADINFCKECEKILSDYERHCEVCHCSTRDRESHCCLCKAAFDSEDNGEISYSKRIHCKKCHTVEYSQYHCCGCTKREICPPGKIHCSSCHCNVERDHLCSVQRCPGCARIYDARIYRHCCNTITNNLIAGNTTGNNTTGNKEILCKKQYSINSRHCCSCDIVYSSILKHCCKCRFNYKISCKCPKTVRTGISEV